MAFAPRAAFPYPARIPSWFAGHMAQSIRRLPALLGDIDLVIEARDARLPLTSINGTFDRALEKAWGHTGGAGPSHVPGSGASPDWSGKGKGRAVGRVREKIVVYTKRDLAERRYEEPLKKAFLQHTGQQVFFANSQADSDVRAILRHAAKTAKRHEEVMPEMRILVVGMPNVGKSSLLNALRRVGVRRAKAFRVGAEAGVTRKLTGIVKVHEDPAIYVYDTPGVMLPHLGTGDEAAEKGLKYALTAGIKEDLFDQQTVADWLLWMMNRRLAAEQELPKDHPDRHPTYMETVNWLPGFDSPTDDITTFLAAFAKRFGKLLPGGLVDEAAAISFFIRMFREGKLGQWTMDDLLPSLETMRAQSEQHNLTPPPLHPTLEDQVSFAVSRYLAEDDQRARDKEEGKGLSLNQMKKVEKGERLQKRRAKVEALFPKTTQHKHVRAR